MPVLAFLINAIEIGRLMQKLNRTPLLNFSDLDQLYELLEKVEKPLEVMP